LSRALTLAVLTKKNKGENTMRLREKRFYAEALF